MRKQCGRLFSGKSPSVSRWRGLCRKTLDAAAWGQVGGHGYSLTPTFLSPRPPPSRVEETGVVLSLEQTEQHTRRPPQRGTSSQKGIPGNGLGMDQSHCVFGTPRRKVRCIRVVHKTPWDGLLPLSLCPRRFPLSSRDTPHTFFYSQPFHMQFLCLECFSLQSSLYP